MKSKSQIWFWISLVSLIIAGIFLIKASGHTMGTKPYWGNILLFLLFLIFFIIGLIKKKK